MKICMLASASSIHSYRWVKYFAEAGHDITWISLVPNEFEPLDRVGFHDLSPVSGVYGLLLAGLKARRIIAANRPDLVHAHYVGSYGVLALIAGFTPLVATPWGSDVIFGKDSPFKRPFIGAVLRRAALVTCDAWHMRDQVMAFGVPAERIHIINFGIDTQRFRPRGRSLAIRHSLGLGEAPSVISLRNFDPVYDIPTLLRAIPLVLARRPETRFIIVGRGPLEAELKTMAESLGIGDATRFVGFIPNQDLPDWLSSMDVYVSTSLSDAGIAASTAEAMACGLPVVITDSGENERWIEPDENGLLVPVTNPEILAEQVLRLLDDPGLRARLGQAGRETIRARNDYSVEMARMDVLYRELEVKGR